MNTITDINNTTGSNAWPENSRNASIIRDNTGIVPAQEPEDRITIHSSNNRQVANQTVSEKATTLSGETAAAEKKEGFSFRDILDVINPLQHIPIVSNIYRAITGDEIKAPARILGGGIFGGVIGAVAGVVNSVISKFSGKDIGEHVLAALNIGDDKKTVAQTEAAPIAPSYQAETPTPAESVETRIELPGTPENFSILRSLILGEKGGDRTENTTETGISLKSDATAIQTDVGNIVRKESGSAIPILNIDDTVSAALKHYKSLSLPDGSTDIEKRPVRETQVDIVC